MQFYFSVVCVSVDVWIYPSMTDLTALTVLSVGLYQSLHYVLSFSL